MSLMAEVRRRIRTDEEFCGMISKGVAEGKIPLSFLTDVLTNLWQEPIAERAVNA